MNKTQRILTIACSFSTLSLCALETKPWLGNQYEFDSAMAFNYSRFHHVQGASHQPHGPVNNRNLIADVGFTMTPEFDVRIEGEFGKATQVNWALRSGALQMRYQLLDDIAGDPVSLTLGAILRGATGHFLRSVTTPYAAECNMALTTSVGKEWSADGVWTMRTYGLVTLGQANRGSPWTQELLVWQYNVEDTHRFSLFAEGDFGFGSKRHVNVEHFRGWAPFAHRSIDLGASYGYKMGFYGVLTASYAYRVFARNFPERVNFVMLEWRVPFSLF